MLKQFLKRLFAPQIVRIPDNTRVMCFARNGKKYVKVFNLKPKHKRGSKNERYCRKHRKSGKNELYIRESKGHI